jgi:hypothetical protein
MIKNCICGFFLFVIQLLHHMPANWSAAEAMWIAAEAGHEADKGYRLLLGTRSTEAVS